MDNTVEVELLVVASLGRRFNYPSIPHNEVYTLDCDKLLKAVNSVPEDLRGTIHFKFEPHGNNLMRITAVYKRPMTEEEKRYRERSQSKQREQETMREIEVMKSYAKQHGYTLTKNDER